MSKRVVQKDNYKKIESVERPTKKTGEDRVACVRF